MLCVIVLGLSLSGCDFGLDKILSFGDNAQQNAIDGLNEAINSLQNQSVSWQQVLQQLEANLNTDAKNLIDVDIQNVISRTIDQSGSEFRCDADFVNHRVAEDLLVIKAKLLHQTAPALQPQFCSALPEEIQLSQSQSVLSLYGYNFDLTKQLTVKLDFNDGSTKDISSGIHVPTPYLLTVTLAGLDLSQATGVELDWNGSPLSTVAVIPASVAPQVCASRATPLASGASIGPFAPAQVQNGGDRDFAGHGPSIATSVNLNVTPQSVVAALYMDAAETRSDHTEVQGTHNSVLYTAPAGWRIDHVEAANLGQAPMSSHLAYVDQGFSMQGYPHRVQMGPGDLVKEYDVIGDEKGDDVGRASVQVFLNDLTVVEDQVGGCVSSTLLGKMIAAGVLNQQVQSAVASRVALDQSMLRQAVARLHPPLAAH